MFVLVSSRFAFDRCPLAGTHETLVTAFDLRIRPGTVTPKRTLDMSRAARGALIIKVMERARNANFFIAFIAVAICDENRSVVETCPQTVNAFRTSMTVFELFSTKAALIGTSWARSWKDRVLRAVVTWRASELCRNYCASSAIVSSKAGPLSSLCSPVWTVLTWVTFIQTIGAHFTVSARSTDDS